LVDRNRKKPKVVLGCILSLKLSLRYVRPYQKIKSKEKEPVMCFYFICQDASGENAVVPPETYVKVAGHLRSFQVKSNKMVASELGRWWR
jgi:hypothetical protein